MYITILIETNPDNQKIYFIVKDTLSGAMLEAIRFCVNHVPMLENELNRIRKVNDMSSSRQITDAYNEAMDIMSESDVPIDIVIRPADKDIVVIV